MASAPLASELVALPPVDALVSAADGVAGLGEANPAAQYLLSLNSPRKPPAHADRAAADRGVLCSSLEHFT